MSKTKHRKDVQLQKHSLFAVLRITSFTCDHFGKILRSTVREARVKCRRHGTQIREQTQRRVNGINEKRYSCCPHCSLQSSRTLLSKRPRTNNFALQLALFHEFVRSSKANRNARTLVASMHKSGIVRLEWRKYPFITFGMLRFSFGVRVVALYETIGTRNSVFLFREHVKMISTAQVTAHVHYHGIYFHDNDLSAVIHA